MNTTTLLKRSLLPTILVVGAVFLLFPETTFANDWSFVQSFLYMFVVSVFGWLAGLGGSMLDWTINNMVIGFGDLYNNKGLGFTIDGLWVIVRDIFNLTFIFGLVFIGLRLIFDSSNSSARKMLVSLILAALLVNFSLFITKFVVDFSNIAAVQLVNSFPGSPGDAKISGSFMQIMGGPGLFSKGVLQLPATLSGFSAGGGFTFIIGTMIVLIILTFVFLAGAILLMIRFVALNFYMLLSPLMFAGMVFPSAGRITQEFWSGFLGKAFFAPAYILMLYFSHKILSTFQVTGEGKLASAFIKGDKAEIDAVLPPFILGSIFLIASLVIAQKMGATGASGVISVGKMMTGKAKGYAKNAAWGTTKFVASQTAGRGARRATYAIGNTLSRQVDRFQNSNNSLVRGLARTTGVDSAVRGTATKMQNARFGLSQTREQEQANSNRIYQAADNRQREQQAAQQVRGNAITAASTNVDITNRQNARQAHATEVSQMSNEQIVERARQDRAYVMSPEFASLLSDANVAALRNSGIYDNAEMTQLEQNRTDGALAEVNQVLTNSNASVDNLNTAIDNLTRTVGSMSEQRILQAIPQMRAAGGIDPAFAASMTQAQFDSFIGSNASPVDKAALRAERNNGLQRIAQEGSLVDPASPGAASPGATDPGLQDRYRRRLFRNAQQAGLLPAAVLRDPAIVEYLTPRIIEEFLNNNPTAGDIADVRNNVMTYITTPGTPASVTDTWQNWMITTVLGRRFA